MFLVIPVIRVPPSPRSPETGRKTALWCLGGNSLFLVCTLALAAVVIALPMKLVNSYDNTESYDWLGIAIFLTAIIGATFSFVGDAIVLKTISTERPSLGRILGAYYCKLTGALGFAPMFIFLVILRSQYLQSIRPDSSSLSSSSYSNYEPSTSFDQDWTKQLLLDSGYEFKNIGHKNELKNDWMRKTTTTKSPVVKPTHITQSECNDNIACKALMPMVVVAAIAVLIKLVCDSVSNRFYLGCRLYLRLSEIQATRNAWQERVNEQIAVTNYNHAAGGVHPPGTAMPTQVLIRQPGGSYGVANLPAWTPPPPMPNPDQLPAYSPALAGMPTACAASQGTHEAPKDQPQGPPPEYKERE